MSDAKHTPRPWSVGGPEMNTSREHVFGSGRIVADCCHTPHRAEGEANARLIAAAPELLAACELLVAGMDRFDGPDLSEIDAALAAARAAVAKAKGGTP